MMTEKLGWVVNGVKKENKKEGENIYKRVIPNREYKQSVLYLYWWCREGLVGKKRFNHATVYTVESG